MHLSLCRLWPPLSVWFPNVSCGADPIMCSLCACRQRKKCRRNSLPWQWPATPPLSPRLHKQVGLSWKWESCMLLSSEGATHKLAGICTSSAHGSCALLQPSRDALVPPHSHPGSTACLRAHACCREVLCIPAPGSAQSWQSPSSPRKLDINERPVLRCSPQPSRAPSTASTSCCAAETC